MKRLVFQIKGLMLLAWIILLVLAILIGLAAHGLNAQINPLVGASVALNVLVTLIWLFATLFTSVKKVSTVSTPRTFETKEQSREAL